MYKILKQVQSQNLGQTEFMECSVVMKFTFFSLRLSYLIRNLIVWN